MKKLLISLTLVFSVLFAVGCGSSGNLEKPAEKGDTWVEVHSIKYSMEADTETLGSTIEWEFELTLIDRQTYNEYTGGDYKVPDTLPYGKQLQININRAKDIKAANECKNKTYYRSEWIYGNISYYKQDVKGYALHYVTISFVDDSHIKINYYDDKEKQYITKLIMPLAYEITYFND